MQVAITIFINTILNQNINHYQNNNFCNKIIKKITFVGELKSYQVNSIFNIKKSIEKDLEKQTEIPLSDHISKNID